MGLQDQIAALIIAAGGIRFPVICGPLHLLVEIVIAVVSIVATVARLIGQVPQGVISS